MTEKQIEQTTEKIWKITRFHHDSQVNHRKTWKIIGCTSYPTATMSWHQVGVSSLWAMEVLMLGTAPWNVAEFLIWRWKLNFCFTFKPFTKLSKVDIYGLREFGSHVAVVQSETWSLPNQWPRGRPMALQGSHRRWIEHWRLEVEDAGGKPAIPLMKHRPMVTWLTIGVMASHGANNRGW